MAKKTAPVFLLTVVLFCAALAHADGGLTILDIYDNQSFHKAFKNDAGFSCLVKGIERTILFDTGKDGAILMGNLQKLGISPAR